MVYHLRFRRWFAAYLAPSHYLNQWWFSSPNTPMYGCDTRPRERSLVSLLIESKQEQAPYIRIKHDDVIKWKHFPRYWPFVRGIHRSPVPGEFPAQSPVTRSFDGFFDLRLNKRLSKQSWGWWFETLSCQLWRHCNESFHLLHKLINHPHLLQDKPHGCYTVSKFIAKGHVTCRLLLELLFWYPIHRHCNLPEQGSFCRPICAQPMRDVVSHWLCAYTKWSLLKIGYQKYPISNVTKSFGSNFESPMMTSSNGDGNGHQIDTPHY